MTSWLDTKKFVTSLAKTAMVEAQKTLDKALEIDEENSTTDAVHSIDQWGSFTGSFFAMSPNEESGIKVSKSEPVSLQPQKLTVKSSDLLLQPASAGIVKEENSSALMQECDEAELKVEEEMSSSNNTMTSSKHQEEEKKSDSEAMSSSKSFEMLKLESLPTSGHTSGDDVEVITNTSSDIEVISSPVLSENGRKHMVILAPKSPNKKEQMSRHLRKEQVLKVEIEDDFCIQELFEGHLRTSSEVSTCPSEDSLSLAEIDKLLKKLSEMNEIIEAREAKVVELSHANVELQEKNTDLSSQVKEAMKINAKLTEASMATEEFTSRLASMEKKLQQSIAERDKLKEENKKMKAELSSKLSDADVAEKDEIIQALRQEGESLSKQAGKHSEAIKKLRTKEKANEKEIKNLKERLEDKSKECERLAKSLEAKNEVESKQIEAIQNLTHANNQWEEANVKMSSELEDAHEKANGLKLSLESAYKEMGELKRGLLEKEGEAQELALAKETSTRQMLQEQLRQQAEEARLDSDKLLRQIDELREALAAADRNSARTEDRMRREREDLLTKLQESEARHEELSGSLSSSTRPLLRQIESLQASLSEAQMNSDRAERSLSDRLQQATVQLAAAQERERHAAEQYRQLSSKTATMEAKMAASSKLKTSLETQIEGQNKDIETLKEQVSKAKSLNETLKKSAGQQANDFKGELEGLRIQLGACSSDLDSEKRKSLALMDQLQDRDKRLKELSLEVENAKNSIRGKSSSPTFSIASASVTSEQAWPEEVFESRGINQSTLFLPGQNSAGSTSAMLESLQSQLKQKEGENIQLQMELMRLEKTKTNMAAELAKLSEKEEQMIQLTSEHEQLRQLYRETGEKYQTMLTMYGEKVEETEELRLDLQDVKEMYKMQIEDLLRKNHVH